MSVHAPSGPASFAACARLFGQYPLAVAPPAADRGHQSMVLMSRAAGLAVFFVLTRARDDLFLLRSWDRPEGVSYPIRPAEPVPDGIGQVITGGMPVPRDGALLGWVTDSRVTAVLTVHCGQPGSWDTPVPGPEIRVMPMAGTSELPHWPPFTVSPLDDGRLWEYVEWGGIVDLGPLLTQSAGRAFWVPSPDRRDGRPGCVVVTDDLRAEEYWLPAGVYLDHWTLREGIPPPPAACLLALPGATDLARPRPARVATSS